MENVTSLDSIMLSNDLSLNNIKFKKTYFKKIISDDENKNHIKIISYVLKSKYKNEIFGLENIIIRFNKDFKLNHINTKKLNLSFNAKILGTDYLEGLQKKNIKRALKSLVKKLKPYIKLKAKNIYKNFRVGMCDFTKNIKVYNYSINEYLKAVNYHVITNRQLQEIKTTFLDEGTLTFKLSKKEKYLIYDKHKEIQSMYNDKKHGAFIGAYSELSNKSIDVLRCETRVIGNKRIAEILNIELKNNYDFVTLEKLFNININLAYDRLYSFSNKKIDSNIIDMNINKLRDIKKWKKIKFGKILFNDYKDNYSKLKDDIYFQIVTDSKNKNQKIKARREYYKQLDCINYYLCFNELEENKINYTILFNEVLEKLKVA